MSTEQDGSKKEGGGMKQNTLVHHTIREQIATHLRREVFSGQLAEGDVLREQKLAERFGVSRGPIRDALLQLTKEGLLVARQNRGVWVRERPHETIRPLVVELRRQVESFALETIFERIGPDDLLFWEENLEHFRNACEKGNMGAVVEHDMAFHRSIVEKVEDEGLLAIWLPIVTHMMLPYSRHQSLMESYGEHRGIVEAIEAEEREMAVKGLKDNIQ
jgi:GntR family transcriptional regulator, rspAB operon transcriptional repressor